MYSSYSLESRAIEGKQRFVVVKTVRTECIEPTDLDKAINVLTVMTHGIEGVK
jgi:hypothetical protein